MEALSKYKQNLKVTEDNVYSYNTKVAKIDHTNREIIKLPWNVGGRTTSPTTSKHINYVAEVYGYQVTTFINEDKLVLCVNCKGILFKIHSPKIVKDLTKFHTSCIEYPLSN